MEGKTVTAFKGFDKDLKCRDFQYKIGETYIHDGDVEVCSSGFHACENPFDVWSYYDIASSRFCSVTMADPVTNSASDSKIASAKITIDAEISLPEFVNTAVKWLLSQVKNSKKEYNTGNQSAATNTGYQSAATNTGYQSAATNTGYQSAATNTGNRSAATNTGNRSAATNTGSQSAATNTGYQSAAIVDGKSCIAIASGVNGKAKANNGSAIVLCLYNDINELIKIKSGIAGQEGIKPDVFYMLDKNGNFVEELEK